MKLFHGTTFSASLKIEDEKIIAHKINRPHYKGDGFETTDGYVYLTNNVGYAAYLAQRLAQNIDDLCVVYEIDIDENELKTDIDQLKIIGRMPEGEARAFSVQSSLSSVQSCRISRSLIIGADVIRKLTLPSASNSGHQSYNLLLELRKLRRAGDAEESIALVSQGMWVNL
ncbi:Acyl-CoA synthetase [Erwinia rhapontici]|uniref:hypothetical protein n=1 Tax=Erwinia rhapontici TaxID=55212 RepID=UPI003D366795